MKIKPYLLTVALVFGCFVGADEVISVELLDTIVTVWLRCSTPEDGYEFEFDNAQLAARAAAQFIMQWGSIAR